MKKLVLGSVMVLAMIASVFAAGNGQAEAGNRAGAACCSSDECCIMGAETIETGCEEACCK